MGLISNADDEGRGRANIKLIKSAIFPYDDDLTIKKVSIMLTNLYKTESVDLYTVDGQDFYCLPNFLKHQKINRPVASKLPEPPNLNVSQKSSNCSEDSHNFDEDSQQFDEGSRPIEENRREVNIKEKKAIVRPVDAADPFIDFGKEDPELMQTLNDFVDMRKAMKKPITTDRAKAEMVKRLRTISSKRDDWIKMLSDAIRNNWIDVYPIKEESRPDPDKREKALQQTDEIERREQEKIDRRVDEARRNGELGNKKTIPRFIPKGV